jgi:uncharacterized protein (DUF362 family)
MTAENTIFVTYGDDPKAMARRLLDAAGAAALVPPGATVALKPNLVVARPADGGATTHPEAAAGAIEYFRDHGVRDIEILEGSWVGDDTGRAFAKCGYAALAKRYGVRLHDLKNDAAAAVDTPAGKILVCDRARNAGFLVNMPVLKGHCQTRMTCALKNLKGCIPDSEKRRFHREGLDALIAGLACALRPGLTLVDGICGDLDFEEGGNPVFAGRMALGTDMVRVDALGCRWTGVDPTEVRHLALAAKHGAGGLDLDGADIVELGEPRRCAAPRPVGKAARLARHIAEREACSSCYAALIHALHRMGGTGIPAPERIHVGQGYRGRHFAGIGVGACCAGAARFVPGCPPSAAAIMKTLAEQR